MKTLSYFMFFILVVVLMTSCKDEGITCGCSLPPHGKLILSVDNASEAIPDVIDDLPDDELTNSELKNYFFWGKMMKVPNKEYLLSLIIMMNLMCT